MRCVSYTAPSCVVLCLVQLHLLWHDVSRTATSCGWCLVLPHLLWLCVLYGHISGGMVSSCTTTSLVAWCVLYNHISCGWCVLYCHISGGVVSCAATSLVVWCLLVQPHLLWYGVSCTTTSLVAGVSCTATSLVARCLVLPHLLWHCVLYNHISYGMVYHVHHISSAVWWLLNAVRIPFCGTWCWTATECHKNAVLGGLKWHSNLSKQSDFKLF